MKNGSRILILCGVMQSAAALRERILQEVRDSGNAEPSVVILSDDEAEVVPDLREQVLMGVHTLELSEETMRAMRPIRSAKIPFDPTFTSNPRMATKAEASRIRAFKAQVPPRQLRRRGA